MATASATGGTRRGETGEGSQKSGRAGGRWRANLLLALVSVTSTLAVAVLAGEAVLRHRERTRPDAPAIMPTLYYPHRRLTYALVRNSDYFGWVHIDGGGFRGPEVTEAKPAGVLRIMVVGSSTTFDIGASRDDRTWPARLQYWLQRSDPGRRVQVINAGVPGYMMTDQIVRLETELYRYRPDLLLLYEGHNDLALGLRGSPPSAEAGSPDRPEEVSPQTPWTHWLKLHSLLYGKVKDALGVWSFQKESTRRKESISSSSVQRLGAFGDGFGRQIGVFASVAHELGIPVAMAELVHVSGTLSVTEPDSAIRRDWADFARFASPEMMLQGYARANEVLQAVGTRLRVPVIRTEGFGLRGLEWYAPGDPIHFNDRGSDRMGREMAAALVAAHLLETGAGAH